MRVACLFCCGLLTGVASAQEAGSLHKFTAAHTRVVWVQDQGPANSDILAIGQRLKLMGIDSEDGQGERVLLGEVRNYAKPLLTPDGQRVVFSDQQNQKFYMVNWDGSGKRLLGDGLAVDVWRDPSAGVDWVYAAKRVGKPENVTYRNLRRIKLNEPKTSEQVLDQTEVGCDNFQLSADGTRAGGEFPWPNGGIADLQKKTWQKLEQGCWSSIAPDNSGISWVFDGPHRNLQFHRPDQAAGWKVKVNSAPEISGAEVFHPRWSNHVRYFAMTGPYTVQGKINVISGGGPQVEVYLGRFSPDFKSVEAWHQVTANARGDFYPDVWIAGGETARIDLPDLKTSAPAVVATTWPAITEGLLFAWNNSAQTNQIPDRPGQPGRACQIRLQGRVVPGRFNDLRFFGGTGVLENLDATLLAALKSKQGLTVEMLVTPARVTDSLATICEIGPAQDPSVQLRHSGRRLSVTLPTSELNLGLDEHEAAAPLLIAVTLTAENNAVYLNGRLRVSHPATERVEFKKWTSAAVRLGSPDWRGSLEAVTVYARSLRPEEIERQSKVTWQRLAQRPSIVQTRVQAKCIERSTIPPPAQILPYRRALAVHEFEVQKIAADPRSTKKAEASTLQVNDRILVARWVILDGQVLPEASQPKVGESAELALELVDEHPELKSERQILDVAELDLPLYYDVSEPVNTP